MKSKKFKIAIVVSQFNKEISDALLNGAMDYIIDVEKKTNKLIYTEIFKVPGAFEIPGMVNLLIKNDADLDGILTLGSVIKGETAHFEYISESVVHSIANLSISSNIPIVFGVLTTYDYEQAFKRADVNQLNNGGEVMRTLLDMLEIYSQIKNK